MMTRVDVRPDPRISTLRPGWLADDAGWRDELQSMDRTDVDWIESHWEKAAGSPAAVDTSWVTTEPIGGMSERAFMWMIALLVVVIVVAPSLILMIAVK